MNTQYTDVTSTSKKIAYSIHIGNVVRETSEKNIERRFDASGTSPAFPNGEVKLVQIEPVAPKANVRHAQRQLLAPESLPGSVSNYDDVTVFCAVELPNRRIEVELPRALFDDNLKLGMPFSLTFGHENGLRRPIITPRVANNEAVQADLARIKEIFDKL